METLIAPIRFKPVTKLPISLAGCYVRMLRREEPPELGLLWEKGAIGVIEGEIIGTLVLINFDTQANHECEIFTKYVEGKSLWGATHSEFELVEPADE